MAVLNGSDQVQLCFNRSHFQRVDFNVERFVNLTRKRATLDQLQNDLRIHLRHLQNAMIELINDDYADFVNLSSSLDALHESVEKVTADVQSNWSSFCASIAELQKCADKMDKNLIDLEQSQKKQRQYRDRLGLIRSLQHLHDFIERDTAINLHLPRDFDLSWYSKLALLISAVEFWMERTNKIAQIPQQIYEVKSECFKKICDILMQLLVEELSGTSRKSSNLSFLVLLLQLIDETDYAICHVIEALIVSKIQTFMEEKNLEILLKNVLDHTLNLREVWVKRAKTNKQCTQNVITFMDASLLKFIILFLEKHLTTVLIPTDPRLFHKCYQLITNALKTWPFKGPVQQSLLHSIRDKFNLIIYFKLASQPLLAELKNQSASDAFKIEIWNSIEDGYCAISHFSNSLLLTLDVLYSSDMFLPPLADKFWEFTLQRLEEYILWVEKTIIHFSHDKSCQLALLNDTNQFPMATPQDLSSLDSHAKSTFTWLSLAALYRNTQLFDNNLFQFCLTTIWAHLRELGVDTTPFGQCLSCFTERLAQKRNKIGEMLIVQLEMELSTKLSAVADIPRQYRWTKRPLPICSSTYLNNAFSVCETFNCETRKLGWSDEEAKSILTKVVEKSIKNFCDKAEKVALV